MSDWDERDAILRRSQGCPCLVIEPCDPHCTCVNEFMSFGCLRCASYGSIEQRIAKAKHLTADPRSLLPWTCSACGAKPDEVQWAALDSPYYAGHVIGGAMPEVCGPFRMPEDETLRLRVSLNGARQHAKGIIQGTSPLDIAEAILAEHNDNVPKFREKLDDELCRVCALASIIKKQAEELVRLKGSEFGNGMGAFVWAKMHPNLEGMIGEVHSMMMRIEMALFDDDDDDVDE